MLLDRRYRYYKLYTVHLKNDKHNDNLKEKKIFNKAIKYNHTVVIGNDKFHKTIAEMKVPSKYIYYLKETEIINFLEEKRNVKYKIVKYFFIMEGKRGIEFLETIKYISNVFGLKIVVIVYIANKSVKIDKKYYKHPYYQ